LKGFCPGAHHLLDEYAEEKRPSMRRFALAVLVWLLPGFTLGQFAHAQVRSFAGKNIPQNATASRQIQAAAQTQLLMQGPPATRHPALTERAFTLARNITVKNYIASLFPNLRVNSFEILDPRIGTTYNCIAHSLGIYDRWINPKTGPPGNPLGYMDQMYLLKGYQRAASVDYRVAPGVKKVMLFALVAGGQIQEVTHAAVQQADGTWTSKLGQLPLIRYYNPLAVAGTQYGQPVAMYEAPLYPLLWQNMLMQNKQ
jgi:hypothetical protein